MRLAVLLTQDFADWEAALLMATARAHLGVEVVTASPDGDRVVSMGGLAVAPAAAMAALDPAGLDALVLPGGQAWERPDAPQAEGLVAAFRDAGRPVAAICAATLVLAKAGVLDRIPHTSNAPGFLAATGYAGGAHYREGARAVSAEGVVTAPGTAPVSFATAVLAALGRGGPELDGYAAMFGAEHTSTARSG